MDRTTIDRRVRDALRQVGLDGFEGRYQRQLSGGEQQRVALARVLVTQPRILLLDEPLSALDKNLREEMKYWIKGLQRSLGITTIYVTHDQSEALTMSDRIGVMNKARVVQIGSPIEIYERPADIFVTTFIAIPICWTRRLSGRPPTPSCSESARERRSWRRPGRGWRQASASSL
jgi:putative spermidine/putrescine transport system ATP-binding protein